MNAIEVRERIEGPRIRSVLRASSALGIAVMSLVDDEQFRAVSGSLRLSDSLVEATLNRIHVLANVGPPAANYAHPHDIEMVAYLRLIEVAAPHRTAHAIGLVAGTQGAPWTLAFSRALRTVTQVAVESSTSGPMATLTVSTTEHPRVPSFMIASTGTTAAVAA